MFLKEMKTWALLILYFEVCVLCCNDNTGAAAEERKVARTVSGSYNSVWARRRKDAKFETQKLLLHRFITIIVLSELW